MKKKWTDKWTSVAVKKETQSQLKEWKQLKAPGEMENFDDVIRRKTGMPLLPDDEEEKDTE